MPPKPKKPPGKFKSEFAALKSTQATAQGELVAKVIEGKDLAMSEITSLLNSLAIQALPSGNFKIRKLGKSKKWIFEISFDEADIGSRPDVTKALADAGEYAAAADLENPVVEENE